MLPPFGEKYFCFPDLIKAHQHLKAPSVKQNLTTTEAGSHDDSYFFTKSSSHLTDTYDTK